MILPSSHSFSPFRNILISSISPLLFFSTLPFLIHCSPPSTSHSIIHPIVSPVISITQRVISGLFSPSLSRPLCPGPCRSYPQVLPRIPLFYSPLPRSSRSPAVPSLPTLFPHPPGLQLCLVFTST